jgi:UPF0716 protein FxsA
VLLRLLLLFTTIPLAELALLLWIGGRIGLMPTVALILATGALGAALARHQGLATWGRFQEALAAGRLPGRELLEGLLILVAGALLLTPGVLTDAAGFLLLVPPARRWIVGRAEFRLRGRIEVAGAPPLSGWARRPARAPDADAEVIDAEFEVVDRADEGGN